MGKDENFVTASCISPMEARAEFKRYFVKLKKQKKLQPHMEEVLWAHLKSIGCNTPALFNYGIKHFGI